MFSGFISSWMQEENREQKRGKGKRKEVKGREIMVRRKRRMEKEEREQEEAAEEEEGRPCTGKRLSPGAALRELSGLFQATGLWLQAPDDHRGQCETGLFGDVF